MIKQTAGRDVLENFAPIFAHYNDDILFGENWNDDSIDLKTRCIITVVALMSSGITDSSLVYHLENAKKMLLEQLDRKLCDEKAALIKESDAKAKENAGI